MVARRVRSMPHIGNGELKLVDRRLTQLEEEMRLVKEQMVQDAHARFLSTAGSREGSQAYEFMVREGRRFRHAERTMARNQGQPKIRQVRRTRKV